MTAFLFIMTPHSSGMRVLAQRHLFILPPGTYTRLVEPTDRLNSSCCSHSSVALDLPSGGHNHLILILPVPCSSNSLCSVAASFSCFLLLLPASSQLLPVPPPWLSSAGAELSSDLCPFLLTHSWDCNRPARP